MVGQNNNNNNIKIKVEIPYTKKIPLKSGVYEKNKTSLSIVKYSHFHRLCTPYKNEYTDRKQCLSDACLSNAKLYIPYNIFTWNSLLIVLGMFSYWVA